jgi:hypothetical protein
MPMDTSIQVSVRFPPDLYRQVRLLARTRRVSFAHLVREACRSQYPPVSFEARRAAVESLATMRLPVGPPDQLDAESVPPAELRP